MPLFALDDAVPLLADSECIWIAPDASVIGRVTLGRDVGIWFGAVLRGDGEPIAVGDGTNIQEHSMLHTDPGAPVTVGRDCTVGHRAILHGCTIGEAVLVGMGAIILNRAVIGEESLVGAGALVTEGKVFPPRSLIVGAPAKVIRTLDDAAVAAIRDSAARYRENARRFKAGLRRL